MAFNVRKVSYGRETAHCPGRDADLLHPAVAKHLPVRSDLPGRPLACPQQLDWLEDRPQREDPKYPRIRGCQVPQVIGDDVRSPVLPPGGAGMRCQIAASAGNRPGTRKGSLS